MNNVHLEGGVRHVPLTYPFVHLKGPPPLKKGRAYCAPSVPSCASGPHDALALGDLENSPTRTAQSDSDHLKENH